MVGQTFGHYRVTKPLGHGGMGYVYLADDARLKRQVALKFLPGEVAGDPARLERFEREAQIVAALNHPNIVTVHSIERDNGTLFMAMEYLDGRTLAEIIPRGGLPLSRLLTSRDADCRRLGRQARRVLRLLLSSTASVIFLPLWKMQSCRRTRS